jgi:hypothetical protein
VPVVVVHRIAGGDMGRADDRSEHLCQVRHAP